MNKIQVNIEVRTEDDILAVECPYLPTNINRFKAVGGKWDGKRFWLLPDSDSARNLLKELFNWVEGCGLTKVTLDFNSDDVEVEGNQLNHRGYVLASRKYRDANVVTPAGVILSKGTYSRSGGSVKNPNAYPDKDSEGNAEYILTMFDGKAAVASGTLTPAKERIQKLIADLKKEISTAGFGDASVVYTVALESMEQELLNL